MTTTTIGVSLKMYFGHARALEWIDVVASLARSHPAIVDGSVELFVIPSFVAIPAAVSRLEGTGVLVGAQDLATEDSGAYTGEVSGAELAEVGASVVEVGHAERRSLFFETDEVVAAKTIAALRNGLAPVLCIGESARTSTEDAAAECLRQLNSALEGAVAGRIIVAYEPVWAIGSDQPADPSYIRAVCAQLQTAVALLPDRENSVVIYGGSAGPGLLASLGTDVDGLFLGRFAHDPAALRAVIDEAGARA
jgi:triosephosphate isomerase